MREPENAHAQAQFKPPQRRDVNVQPHLQSPPLDEPRLSSQARRNLRYAPRLSIGESLRSVRCTTQELVQYKEIDGGPSRVPAPSKTANSRNGTTVDDDGDDDDDHNHQHYHQHGRRHKSKENDEEHWLRKSLEGSSRRNASPRRAKITTDEVACHSCHRINSPEWRQGPNGPGTLCNVCGLIYAKRETHRRESEQWKEKK